MSTFIRCKPVSGRTKRAKKYHLFPAADDKLFPVATGPSLCEVWSQASTINCVPQHLTESDFSGDRPKPFECLVCHHNFRVQKGGAR